MGEEEEEEELRRRPGEIRFGGMSFALPPPGGRHHDEGGYDGDGDDDGDGNNDEDHVEICSSYILLPLHGLSSISLIAILSNCFFSTFFLFLRLSYYYPIIITVIRLSLLYDYYYY